MFKLCFSLEQLSRSSPRLLKFKVYFHRAVKPAGQAVSSNVQRSVGSRLERPEVPRSVTTFAIDVWHSA